MWGFEQKENSKTLHTKPTRSRWNNSGRWVSKQIEKVNNPHTEVNPSQWNDFSVLVISNEKKPYLTYNINVTSTRLNIPKLSDYQVSLYQKICDLRFDENLTWKQVSDKLNKLGYTSTRGKKNISSTVCSTYFKIRKHFERKHKYLPPDLDDVELIWE